MPTELTDKEIEGLLDEWHHDASIHSFAHTILRGAAFDELKQVQPKERLLPFLFRLIRDEGPWMGYMEVVRRITGVDIGSWGDHNSNQKIPEGWRAYDVRKTGRLWLEWGRANGYIDETTVPWDQHGNTSWSRNICYKCREHDYNTVIYVDGKPEDHNGPGYANSLTRVFMDVCPQCGVIEQTVQRCTGDPLNDWKVDKIRVWRGEKAVNEAGD